MCIDENWDNKLEFMRLDFGCDFDAGWHRKMKNRISLNRDKKNIFKNNITQVFLLKTDYNEWF